MSMMEEFRGTSTLFGGNMPFIEEQYERYLADPGSVGDSWRAYFDKLRDGASDVAHGPVIDSFIQHTNADQKLGHEGVFGEMCASIPPLTRREVKDAMNTVKSMAEHLMLFMDGIDLFYTRFPIVPRVPCTLLSE